MTLLRHLFLSLIFCALPFTLLATTTSGTSSSSIKDVIPVSKDQSNVPKGYVQMECPTAGELNYDTSTRLWSAPPYFKSYSTSFSKSVKKFSGTQWSGAGVGQIFCVYEGGNKLDFPIMLAFNTTVAEPSKMSQKNVWTDNLKGHRNCITHDTTLCPFRVKTPSKKTTIDDTLDDLSPKDKSNSAHHTH